jgi:hypothetical protein
MISPNLRRQLIVASGLLIGSIALYSGGVYAIAQADQKLAALATEITEAEIRVSSEEATARFVRSLVTERTELSSRFVASDDLVSFLAEVEAVGTRAGVVLDIDSVAEDVALIPGAPTPKKGKDNSESQYPIVILSLSAGGTWDSVMRFLGMIEAMPYGVSIESVNLEHTAVERADWTLLVRMYFAASGTTKP